MRNYDKYDINKVLELGLDLKRMAIMDYFYCNSDKFTKYPLGNEEYILFIPRTVSDALDEITTQPDAILKTVKNLEREGYTKVITGHFNCSAYGYCRTGVYLTQKFYSLFK
jgi:DNA-binding MarR family transcriptional regulator